ncbi:MAG: 4-hydroxy-tetrahydrodipicolinate reductase [bacterium]
MNVKIGLHGASGRMGQTLTELISTQNNVELAAAYPLSDDPVGESAEWLSQHHICLDVLIDFSLPEALDKLIGACIENKTPIVTGTTGLTEQHFKRLQELAKHVPVFWSANMSFGVAVLASLVEQAAQNLDEGWDIEICETHHRYKKDAPSGTALLLGQRAEKGRGNKNCESFQLDRMNSGTRQKGEIGFSSLRGGSEAGTHHVYFLNDGEQISLCHQASSRVAFAFGALRAARWLLNQPAGFYGMQDLTKLQG